MGWYKLIFKQNQPIHVGASKWGVVNETEIFIPGQTIWGALTNTYMRKNRKSFKESKELFEQISNFFPSFDKTTTLKPAYKDGNFYLGNFSEEEFRFYFVDTLVQTAITPVIRAATDESLHEIDFILPKPKQNLENFNDNLYWIGIIKADDSLKDFFQTGMNIYIGADARYGFGELELVEIENLNSEDKSFWWIESNNISIKDNKSSPYFIKSFQNMKIEGEIQLIPELLFRQNIPTVTDVSFYASVGSKLKHNPQKRVKLYKGKLIDGDTMS